MDDNQISNLLTIVLAIAIVILVFLVIIFIIIGLKNRANSEEKQKDNLRKPSNESGTTSSTMLGSESIFKFMEFEDIKDNMIIQKKGVKYLMVIECQGINYDLMSEIEKVAVEEGFIQFLNTLRYPIQIYVQTRSINLEKSIQMYKEKIKTIEDRYNNMRATYESMLDDENYSDEDLQKYFFELTKITNLYEYGMDVIDDTQRMSLNRNILNRTYYIVVPYYPSDLGNENLDVEEIQGIAFSELYTRCQSIIRTISSCNVTGKILSSNNLIELLYMAYNRDGAETFGVERALRADYDQLYSTSPDVLNKKMQALDNKIEEMAVEKATNSVSRAKREIEKRLEEKEEKMDDLIDQIAKIILKENKAYIGEDVAKEAINQIDNDSKEKGEKENVQKAKKGRPRKNA